MPCGDISVTFSVCDFEVVQCPLKCIICAGVTRGVIVRRPRARPRCRRDCQPVGEGEGYHVEKLSAELYDEYLTGKYEERNQGKFAAPFEMERAAVCHVGSGVKHVPEL